jgi:hypothetical protein
MLSWFGRSPLLRWAIELMLAAVLHLLDYSWSSVLSPAVFEAGFLARDGWQRLPLYWFWGLGVWRRGEIAVAFSAISTKETSQEFTVDVPFGDAIAYATIRESVHQVREDLTVRPIVAPRQPGQENVLDALAPVDPRTTLVSIGGGKSNTITPAIFAASEVPLHGFDHLAPDWDSKVTTDRRGRVALRSELVWVNGKIEGSDLGKIVRLKRWRSRPVILLVGSYSHGTNATARWVTQPQNLRWLFFRFALLRLWALVSRRIWLDGVEVVIRVSASDHEISQIRVLAKDEIVGFKHSFVDRKGVIGFRSPIKGVLDPKAWIKFGANQMRTEKSQAERQRANGVNERPMSEPSEGPGQGGLAASPDGNAGR